MRLVIGLFFALAIYCLCSCEGTRWAPVQSDVPARIIPAIEDPFLPQSHGQGSTKLSGDAKRFRLDLLQDKFEKASASKSFSSPRMSRRSLDAEQEGGWGYINARNPPFNATGDGTTDDTFGIQTAINTARSRGGGTVFLPAGTYLIKSNMIIFGGVTLAGVATAPWFSWGTPGNDAGTTLLAVSGAGSTNGTPFITLLEDNSGLEGVAIFYPNQVQSGNPTPYPFAIQGGSTPNVQTNDLHVQNVLLVNPYQGIDFGTYPCPRHFIRGVYGQPLRTGIVVDQCYDIGRIEMVHFWPFWSSNQNLLNYINNQAFTFVFYRSDWEVVQDVFSWGYHVGMLFKESKVGTTNGQFSNIDFDNVDVGLALYSSQDYGLMFSNLNIANAGGGSSRTAIVCFPGESAYLVVRGGSFWGKLTQIVNWQCQGLLSFSDSIIQNWESGNTAIEATAGRIIVRGNYFHDKQGTAISISSGVDRAIITENELVGNPLKISLASAVVANNDP